jgi:predicted nuclease of restriction endonuclease-like RecB superfamily
MKSHPVLTKGLHRVSRTGGGYQPQFTDRATIADSLYADRETRQVPTAFEPWWSPNDLLVQYALSLAQTALFDPTELRVRSLPTPVGS